MIENADLILKALTPQQVLAFSALRTILDAAGPADVYHTDKALYNKKFAAALGKITTAELEAVVNELDILKSDVTRWLRTELKKRRELENRVTRPWRWSDASQRFEPQQEQ